MPNEPVLDAALALLAATAADWGLPLDRHQQAQFATYAQQLQAWNARHNLTAVADPQGIVVRHFLDSLACARVWGDPPTRLIDIGSGAGFPGLPLKLLHPALHLTLAESVEKKSAFLQHMAHTLALDGVTVLATRAEALGQAQQHRAQYDLAVARAVADLRVLAEYCLPLCRLGGRFLAPKGAQIEAELADSRPAIELLGGRLVAVEPVTLPGVEPRVIVVIEKVAATPARYPRRVGIPSKRPL